MNNLQKAATWGGNLVRKKVNFKRLFQPRKNLVRVVLANAEPLLIDDTRRRPGVD